jgi:osmotically-inducible protein OsmY
MVCGYSKAAGALALIAAAALDGCTATEVTRIREESEITGSPSQALALSEEKHTDHNLENHVRDTLLSDPRLGPLMPTVQVQNGVAILMGEVASLEAKAFAEQDARITPGITGVVNQLRVREDTVARDARAQHAVRQALAFNADRLGPRVDAVVKDGIVTLYGQVDSLAKKRLAESVVAGVGGTTVIRNQISIIGRG